MKYDTVIVEMLSRIQALEEQVAELKNEQKKEAEKEINKVSTADIRTFIDGMINEAANSGKDSITLKALDIHNAMGLTSRYPNLRISRSVCWHGTISGFIRIIRFIKALSFRICLELLDDSVSVLWIIFGNECFNTGRIKDSHVGFRRVNRLADGFGNINKVIENELQII